MSTPQMNEPGSAANFLGELRAALGGDENAFAAAVEPYRREIQTHCYRILGSVEDAEDLVQETFLRAWRRLETYAGRASLRAWLYKIATNACLDALERLPKRTLPSKIGPPSDPSLPFQPPILEPIWVQPYPDEWIAPLEANPEARYSTQESISLAFTVALQVLPPRQRCALILADVLDWSAVEIAEVLETSVPAINSLLHRARITLKHQYDSGGLTAAGKAADPETRILLDRYLRAWEAADIDAIIALLTEDARFPMPPLPGWYQGRAAIRTFIAALMAATSLAGATHRWRLLPFQANLQPGFAFYQLDATRDRYLPFALQVLQTRDRHIAEAITFGFSHLFQRFNLPLELPVD